MSATTAAQEMALDLTRATGSLDFTYPMTVEKLAALAKLATSYHRRAEASCNGFQTWNGDWDEKADNANDAAMDKLETRARKIAETLPGGPYGLDTNGDPRGAPFRLTHPDPTTNAALAAHDFGRRGYPILRSNSR